MISVLASKTDNDVVIYSVLVPEMNKTYNFEVRDPKLIPNAYLISCCDFDRECIFDNKNGDWDYWHSVYKAVGKHHRSVIQSPKIDTHSQ